MSKPFPSRDSGFTLIEVIVALAIAALVAVAASALLGGALRGQERAERTTLALLAAESKLAELGVIEPLRPGRREGSLAGGMVWRTQVSPYRGLPRERVEAAPVAAYEVEVIVGWAGSSDGSVSLRTIRLSPKAVDG